MHLQNLRLINFKNYADQSVTCAQEVNCLVGKNGSGKTNFLDAVYYLAFAKSAFNGIDSQNIRHGEGYLSLLAQVSIDDHQVRIQCSVPGGQKKVFKWNKKPYDKLSEHIGKLPVVLISPYDTDLIRDGSELRRRFFDMIISMFDSQYLDKLIRYNRFLKQRNTLLKDGAAQKRWDQTLIDTYDVEIISLSKYIATVRKAFAASIIERFNQLYRSISAEQESTDIVYETRALDAGFEADYKGRIDRDKLLQRTTMGVHRDDYLFMIGGRPIKKFGSQGQQKSFAISLKLAQFQVLEEHLRKKPILLLDDIFDKLDDQRIAVLIQLITGKSFGQIFLTDARPERTRQMLEGYDGVVQFFEVDQGHINPLPLS